MSKFYVVQRAGVPAIWQSDPEHIADLLRRKTGYTIAAAVPSETRQSALTVLRTLFPGHRPVKTRSE
jgi:hypothetical protein